MSIACTYLSTLYFFTPVYKFHEIYHEFPSVNFTLLRLVLSFLLVVALFLYSIKNFTHRKWAFYTISGVVLALILFGIILIKFTLFPFSFHTRNEWLSFYYRVDSSLLGYPGLFFSGYIIFRRGSYAFLGRIVTLFWLFYCSFYFFNWRLLILIFYGAEIGENNINYIFLSSGFSLISLYTMYTWKDTMWNNFIFLISLSLLFVIPSRSTFISFFVSSSILYYGRSRFNGIRSAFMVSILFVGFVFSSKISEIDQILENSRLLNTDLSDDTSLEGRRDIARKNLLNFESNWFFGDFFSDVRLHGESGHETHSYLSFWEQFGVFPFMLFIILYSSSGFYLVFEKHGDHKVRLFLIALFVYTSILVIFARGFNESLPFFCIGSTLGFYDRNRVFESLKNPI
jgi:hypothetical protein